MKRIEVKLVKSLIGIPNRHKKTAESLGLRKINQIRKFEATNDIIGKINQIAYRLKIKEIEEN